MNKKTTLLIIVPFALLGLVAFSYYVYSSRTSQKACDPATTTEDCKPISLDTSTWKVFENQKYGYAISYPPEGDVQSESDYGGVESMYFGIRGRFTLGGVDASIYPSDEAPKAQKLDLKSYAETIRMLQVNSSNPNFKNQKIGGLQETMVDGRKAYQFILDQGFATAKQHPFGYAIPIGQTYLYTIAENLRGQKLIIRYYLGNSIAEAMFRTFSFK